MTMDFNSQTGTSLVDDQHLRRNPHILSDVKMTHSTLTESPLEWQKVRSEQGGTMLDAKKFTPIKILYGERYS